RVRRSTPPLPPRGVRRRRGMRAVGGGAGDVGEDGRVRGPAARRSPAPPRGGTGAVLPGAAPPCGRSPGERPHGRTPEPPVREMSKTAWSDYRRNPTVEICREWRSEEHTSELQSRE